MAVDVLPPPNFNNNHNESKLFLGGLSWDTSEEDILNYFNKYGQILDVTIKYDPVSGHPRGFGFITFVSSDCIDNVLRAGPHTLKNKLIDPKRAKSRPISKKVFVGGIDANTSESEIRRHFNKFGKIEGIELPYDRQRGKRREFCFIIFENEEAADVAVKESKQTIDGRECDVKKAQPQPVAQQQKRMQQTQNQVAANYPNPGMFAYGYDDYAWPDPAAAMGAGASGMPDRRRQKKGPPNGLMHGGEPAWNYNGYTGYENNASLLGYGYDYFGQYGLIDYSAYGYGTTTTGASQQVIKDTGSSSSIRKSSSQTSSSNSAHIQHNSNSGKSSSRKSASSSAYHPYKSSSH